MIELIRAGVEIQTFLKQKKWKFCFIGGLAVIRWGEPRFTRDIDLTVLSGFGNEEEYIDALIKKYKPRRTNMRNFALQHRVLLLKTRRKYPVDISLGALAFEEKMVARSSMFQFADKVSLRTCSAEDLIITKAFAEREQDWLDVQGVILRQAKKLDWGHIMEELTPLSELKESPHIISRLEAIRQS